MRIVAKIGRAVVLAWLVSVHLDAPALQGPLKPGDIAALTDKSMRISIPVGGMRLELAEKQGPVILFR